jgi:hypothetical protein
MASVPAAVLVFLGAAAVAGPQDAGKGRDAMERIHGTPGALRPALPEIDRRIPPGTETATFALG